MDTKTSAVLAVGGAAAAAACLCSRGRRTEPGAAETVAVGVPDAELGEDALECLNGLADIVTLMHHKDVEQNKPTSLAGVYSYDESSGAFSLAHSETGVPYGKTDKETVTAKASLQLKDKRFKPSWQLTFDSTPHTDGTGINFAGRIFIKHNYAQPVVVCVPGKFTYDPAGRTGDPHASERVGNS